MYLISPTLYGTDLFQKVKGLLRMIAFYRSERGTVIARTVYDDTP